LKMSNMEKRVTMVMKGYKRWMGLYQLEKGTNVEGQALYIPIPRRQDSRILRIGDP
jgi:hypothetical protein